LFKEKKTKADPFDYLVVSTVFKKKGGGKSYPRPHKEQTKEHFVTNINFTAILC
jgi:hypothetical protein